MTLKYIFMIVLFMISQRLYIYIYHSTDIYLNNSFIHNKSKCVCIYIYIYHNT